MKTIIGKNGEKLSHGIEEMRGSKNTVSFKGYYYGNSFLVESVVENDENSYKILNYEENNTVPMDKDYNELISFIKLKEGYEEEVKEVRFFIPVPQDEYGNTHIGKYIVSATVEKNKDKKCSEIWPLDMLHVVEPKEVKEKWSVLKRGFFIEVYDVKAGEISGEKLLKLYEEFKIN